MIQTHSELYLSREIAKQLIAENNRREQQKSVRIKRYDPAQKVWVLAFEEKVVQVKKTRAKRVNIQLCINFDDEMNQTQN